MAFATPEDAEAPSSARSRRVSEARSPSARAEPRSPGKAWHREEALPADDSGDASTVTFEDETDLEEETDLEDEEWGVPETKAEPVVAPPPDPVPAPDPSAAAANLYRLNSLKLRQAKSRHELRSAVVATPSACCAGGLLAALLTDFWACCQTHRF